VAALLVDGVDLALIRVDPGYPVTRFSKNNSQGKSNVPQPKDGDVCAVILDFI